MFRLQLVKLISKWITSRRLLLQEGMWLHSSSVISVYVEGVARWV